MIFAKVDVELRDHDKGPPGRCRHGHLALGAALDAGQKRTASSPARPLRGSWRGERQAVADMRKLVEVGLAVESVKDFRTDFARTSPGLRFDFARLRRGLVNCRVLQRTSLQTIAARRQAEVERQERFRRRKRACHARQRRWSRVSTVAGPTRDKRSCHIARVRVRVRVRARSKRSENFGRSFKLRPHPPTPRVEGRTRDRPGCPRNADRGPDRPSARLGGESLAGSQARPRHRPPLTLSGAGTLRPGCRLTSRRSSTTGAERGKSSLAEARSRSSTTSAGSSSPRGSRPGRHRNCLAIDGACNTRGTAATRAGRSSFGELILRDAPIERHGLCGTGGGRARPRPDEPVSASPPPPTRSSRRSSPINAAESLCAGLGHTTTRPRKPRDRQRDPDVGETRSSWWSARAARGSKARRHQRPRGRDCAAGRDHDRRRSVIRSARLPEARHFYSRLTVASSRPVSVEEKGLLPEVEAWSRNCAPRAPAQVGEEYRPERRARLWIRAERPSDAGLICDLWRSPVALDLQQGAPRGLQPRHVADRDAGLSRGASGLRRWRLRRSRHARGASAGELAWTTDMTRAAKEAQNLDRLARALTTTFPPIDRMIGGFFPVRSTRSGAAWRRQDRAWRADRDRQRALGHGTMMFVTEQTKAINLRPHAGETDRHQRPPHQAFRSRPVSVSPITAEEIQAMREAGRS